VSQNPLESAASERDRTTRHPVAGQSPGAVPGREVGSAASPGTRPLLAVDVDGVISIFGFDEPPGPAVARWELIDGTPHCISLAAGERLVRLSTSFELVWATGWQDRANDMLPGLIGVGPLPVIEFDLPRAGTEPATSGHGTGDDDAGGHGSLAGHWKLEALTRFAGDRALAWIDDSLDDSCFAWAADRETAGLPTLLAPAEPHIGIEEGHVAGLEAWAAGLAAGPP
jgi:hypothetical protein